MLEMVSCDGPRAYLDQVTIHVVCNSQPSVFKLYCIPVHHAKHVHHELFGHQDKSLNKWRPVILGVSL